MRTLIAALALMIAPALALAENQHYDGSDGWPAGTYAKPPSAPQPPADRAALMAAAKAAVERKLKDPESARFSDLFVSYARNGQPAVCGEVNAKNSFGGYVGRKQFYFYESARLGPVVEIQGTTERDNVTFFYAAHCTHPEAAQAVQQ